MFTLKLHPQDPSSIIKQAFSLYKQEFSSAMSYALPATLCFFLPSFLSGPQMSLTERWEQTPFVATIIILGWILGLLFQTALVFKLHCASHHSPCRWFTGVQVACYKIFPFILLAALYSLVVLSGTMVLIVPGIILAFSLMFSFILVIIENQTVLQSLTASHRLVWGHWWHTTTILAFVFFLNTTLYSALFFSIFLLCDNCIFTMQQGETIFVVTNLILQTLFMPFIFSTALVLLNDLRVRTPRTMTF